MKDAYFFGHDSNAHNDPKMLALRIKKNWEAVGLYWTFLEILRDLPNYKYVCTEDYLKELELRLSTPQATLEATLEAMLQVGLLVKKDGFLYSESFISRMREIDERRAVLSAAGRRGGLKSSQAQGRLKPPSSRKGKERKGKENKGNTIALEVLTYFNKQTNKQLTLTENRVSIINSLLKKDIPLPRILLAIDNFAKDDWADRHKYCDIIYCLGVRNKIDNFEKWANHIPKETVMEGF